MAKVRLTQGIIDERRTTEGITWDADVTGLGFRVQAGNPSWVVRYRVAGVRRQISLSASLPLRRAREQALEIIVAAKRGVDVVEEGREAAKAKRKTEVGLRTRSVKAIADAYLADVSLSPRTMTDLRRYLIGHWAPLHEHDADSLDRRTIVAQLEEIVDRHGIGTPLAG